MIIYKTYHSTAVVPKGKAGHIEINGILSLSHYDRYVRRKLLHFDNGNMIMLDLNQPTQLTDGDLLATENGKHFRISAAIEQLSEVKGKNASHLLELVWHLGNRHLAIEIFPDCVTVLRNHVSCTMLKGLGASVRDIDSPFQPLHGAYHDLSHGSV
ncbi:MAG: urease accessory protein [Candidatus Tokpelaia sp. JSC085]|nr:MAG: urease accessory protein [Candidatus Tokpelaia sp. JSC085]